MTHDDRENHRDVSWYIAYTDDLKKENRDLKHRLELEKNKVSIFAENLISSNECVKNTKEYYKLSGNINIGE